MVLGLVLATLTIATAASVLRLSRRADLEVALTRDRPLVLADEAQHAEVAGRIRPSYLGHRVSATLDGKALGFVPTDDGQFSLLVPRSRPGLHFVSWRVSYGGRWRREATMSFLEGPFASEAAYECNAHITISQTFLDDGLPNSGGDLATALQPLALARVNETLAQLGAENQISLPVAETLSLSIRLVPDGVRVRIDVRDFFWMEATIGLTPDGTGRGLTPVRVGAVEHGVYPAFRDIVKKAGRDVGGSKGAAYGLLGCLIGPWGCLLGPLIGESYGETKGEKDAQSKADTALGESFDTRVLPELATILQVPEAMDLSKDGSGASVSVRLCTDVLIIEGHQMSVGLNIRVKNRQSRTVPGLSGPVLLGGQLAEAPARAGVTLYASPDLVNALIYALWQSGTLRRFISSTSVLRSLNDHLQDLSVQVRDVDPILPPVLMTSLDGTAFELRAGEVRLALDESTAQGHRALTAMFSGSAVLGFASGRASVLSVAVDLQNLGISCVALGETSEIRRPCFSDVLMLASEQLRGPNGDPILNVKVELDSLLARMRPSPRTQMDVTVSNVLLEKVDAIPTPWLSLSADVSVGSATAP
jgi:hypothetical protein